MAATSVDAGRSRMLDLIEKAGGIVPEGSVIASKDQLSGALDLPPPPTTGATATSTYGRGQGVLGQSWTQQQYIKDNTPWYLDAITTGPVGGFLNAIQKPLAFTTSAMKEGIDIFTGGDASWGDFKKQYDDNYTFGRLLHDYDILQNRDSGWQRFAAAAVGFVGDVALDPLSYLGLIGKGVAFGSVLAKGGAKQAARELVRKAALTQLRTKGDDVMRGVARGMRRGDWEALSDDLAQKVADGGKQGLKDLGDDGWEWTAKVQGQPEQAVRFTNDEVKNLEDFMDIGGRAVKDGATAVSGDDLRYAAKMFADSGLDRNLRHGADEFVDELGMGLREQVAEAGLDESVEATVRGFKGGSEVSGQKWVNGKFEPVQRRNTGWFSPEEAAKMKLSFGLKVPFTGPIGRKLGVAKKIEKIIQKTGASGAQIPIGLRLMTSETPIIGKLVTGVPQGVRNGILRQAAKAAGVKNVPDALKRGGLFRLAGKLTPEGWTMSGRLGDLKTAVKNSTDGVFIQQGKRVVHAMARGRNKARFAKVEMTQQAAAFMDDVKVARSGNADVTNELVYSAMGGNKDSIDALEAMAPGLHARGLDTMENMRTIANNNGGRLGGHIGQADNYVPRQLTPEAHEALKVKMADTGKFSERVHGRRMGQPGGPELTRNYISKQQFDNEVAALAAKDGISTEAAEQILREDRTYEFFGTELLDPGSKMGIVDPTTGKEMIAGSVEDQIAEAIEAAGGNYQLFTNDIEMALKGYIDQVSHRVGEVYTESLLFNEGVLIDRMAEYVRLPTAAAVEAGTQIRAAQEAYVGAQGRLMQHLRAADEDVLNAADEALNVRQREKLEEVVRQKADELKVLDKRQARLLEENMASHSAYEANRVKFDQLTTQMEVLDQQIAGTPAGPQLVAMEKKRIRLVNAAAELASDAPTLKFAYETLTSGTVQLMHLERSVGRIFGTGEAFEAFAADDLLRGLRTDDLNASLLELEQAGTLPDSVIAMDGPDGARAYLYQTAEGKTLEMEQLFMDLDEVLQQSDQSGIGVWLGVERDLDIMRAADNEVAKIDFAMTRVRTEIDEMKQVIDEYAELAPDVLAPDGGAPLPTPEQVTAAEAEILEVTDRLFGQAGGAGRLQVERYGWEAAIENPELRRALTTYYAGTSKPVSAFIDNGTDLEGIISQVSDTLYGSIDGVNRNIELITQAAEASGQKVRLRIVDAHGQERWMTVADYVQMEEMYKHTKQFQATMQSPADSVRLSIDEILSGNMVEEQLGSNPGGRFEINGEEFYVKQYGDATATGTPMPRGTGRDRITSEVLGNAIYRELGIGAPVSYASRHSDGSLWHIAPWIDDVTTVQASGLDPLTAVIATDEAGLRRLTDAAGVLPGEVSQTVANALTRGMAADMLLGNWDVVGMGFDNIGVSATDGLVRIDQGSTFFYRAQGSAKADTGWLPEAMTDADRVGGMLDPSVNEWYAPLANAGIAEDTFDATMANQVRELLDMRLKAGGMENFVRRMMPTPLGAQDDLTKFVEFLEVRLEAMANRYGQEFIAAGSDDMTKAALSARGFSEDVIEDAVRQGTEMRLFHLTSEDPPLMLSQRFGRSNEPGWGDKTFLNMSPGNMYYGMKDYGYNMLLDLPAGPKGIKVYGVAPGADEIRAAELALQISEASSTDEVRDLIDQMSPLVSRDPGMGSTLAGSTPVGPILLDQVSRVAESDPDFFRQFLRMAERNQRKIQTETGRYVALDAVNVVKAADDMRHIRVPTDIGSWGLDDAPRSVVTGKLAASSFEDRLKFALWMEEAHTAGAHVIEYEKWADLYTQYLVEVDPAVNPSGWALGAAKENRRVNQWGQTFDDVLHGDWRPSGLKAQATMPTHKFIDPEQVSGWYLSRFFHKYQNSLSADGYHAAMWLNEEGANLASGNMGQIMPNFMATNPLALRSADVAMTHRNISRLAEAEMGVPLRPEDLRVADSELLPPADPHAVARYADDGTPISAMDEWNAKMQGLGETKTLDEISDELFAAWPPPPEHPFWVDAASIWDDPAAEATELDFLNWFDTQVDEGTSTIFDPNYGSATTPEIRATAQAIAGETKFIEPLPFMEWWEADVLAGPGGLTDNGVPDPDILQTLVERRVQVMADMTTSKQLYDDGVTALEEAVALRNATEKARSGASMELSTLDIEEWMANTAVAQRTAQMDRAVGVLERMGAPGVIPLENLPDDLVDLRFAVGALIENDEAMLKFAMAEFEEGAADWVELLSGLPEGARDIRTIGNREEVLESVFRSGMKPFGQLQGNATLVESMLATERFVARGGAAGFFKRYDKLHNLLRAYMIAKPGFHGRNFMSAVFMNHLSGMNWSSYRKFMRAYWKYQEEQATAMGLTARAKSMRKSMRGRLIDPDNVNPEHVAYIRTLAESGALGSGMGQVATEFVETGGRGAIASRLVGQGPQAEKLGTIVDAINPANSRNLPLRLSKQFGMATETFVRGSLGFDTLLKGGNASDAFDDIMKFHFDYDDLSDFERNVVKRVVPFYTWTRKNMPLMMEQFVRRPEVFNRYMSLKKEIELQTDGPPDIIPKWMIRQGAIQLPFKYDGEDMFITPDLPFKAPMELLDPALAMDPDLGIMQRVEIALGSIGTQITPLIKAPYEWKAKQNLWKGYNFEGRYEVVPSAYTMIPGLMPLLQVAGAAGKTYEGEWAMPDYTLHAMAQLLPTFTDYRRLFPDETRYQERSLSNWVSWLTGVGLRTNTKYEQQMEMIRRQYEVREEEQRERSQRGATKR